MSPWGDRRGGPGPGSDLPARRTICASARLVYFSWPLDIRDGHHGVNRRSAIDLGLRPCRPCPYTGRRCGCCRPPPSLRPWRVVTLADDGIQTSPCCWRFVTPVSSVSGIDEDFGRFAGSDALFARFGVDAGLASDTMKLERVLSIHAVDCVSATSFLRMSDIFRPCGTAFHCRRSSRRIMTPAIWRVRCCRCRRRTDRPCPAASTCAVCLPRLPSGCHPAHRPPASI